MAKHIDFLNKLGSIEQKQIISLKELDLDTEYKIERWKE